MNPIYAPPYPHNSIEELFPNIFWVHGSIKIGPGMYMNRNMVIIQDGNELYLVNPVRLSLEEEAKLSSMGKIKAIIRLGDFHGIDDRYYLDKYACDFWCQVNQTSYPVERYDHVISSNTQVPFANAKFFIFETSVYPEAALYLSEHKLLITTDSIQYWQDWEFMNISGKLVLWLMGFRTGLFIGKPWLKRVTPEKGSLASDFEALLKLDFDHLLAAHGKPLIGGAKKQVQNIVRECFNN